MGNFNRFLMSWNLRSRQVIKSDGLQRATGAAPLGSRPNHRGPKAQVAQSRPFIVVLLSAEGVAAWLEATIHTLSLLGFTPRASLQRRA